MRFPPDESSIEMRAFFVAAQHASFSARTAYAGILKRS